MEHEYTICGRIFPDQSQDQSLGGIQKFIQKLVWIEEDFENLGIKFDKQDYRQFSLKSEDFPVADLEQTCKNLSIILNCRIHLYKDHEVYGVANVFNGGSDYEVVDEDCFLWIYDRGTCLVNEKTKFWNEKFISFVP